MESISTSLAFRLCRSVLATIQPPIPRAQEWAKAYPSTPTRPLLDMSQGAPAGPPPNMLLEALAKMSSSPKSSGYGPVLGEPSLRAALAQEMKTVYGKNADITSDDVAITAGCNMAFVAAVMCLAEAGDEVILPVPWYFNHSMTLNLLGIKSVPLYTRSDQGFLPSPDECKKLITSRTKAITLVTPNNPTGAVYPPLLIALFAELARANNIALVIDETYRDLVEHYPPHYLFSPMHTENILPLFWSWRSNLVHLFSFSKSYAIPGHRLGAVVASPEFLGHISTVLDCMQICAPRPPQLALARSSLLSDLRPSIRANAKALKARHELFRKLLPPGWTIGSQGGFYAFVRHPSFQNASGIAFCERLAKQLGVLVLPAQFFYDEGDETQKALDGWLRFSVANVDDERIVQVCERLRACKTNGLIGPEV